MSVEFSELLAMINSLFIASSTMDRGSGLETQLEAKSQME
jgi:hypothetical protein